MQRLERTKNRKKNKLRYIIIFLCLGIFFYSAYHVGSNYYRAYKSQKAMDEEAKKVQEQLDEAKRREEEARNAAQQSGEDSQGTEEGQGGEETYTPFVLNFDELQAVNSDIMGWLSVDGTNINYPVLYSYTDREFYLYHNYWGEYDPQGSIFIENFNSRDLTDFNTIIYGHSMLNGNMFGTLHNYSHWDIFSSYGGITFYTPYATYHYMIFETATIDNKHIFTYLDNSSYDSIQNYIATIDSYSNGFRRDGYYITPEDHILTLSTCTTDDNKRLVAFAVLVSVD